MPADQHHRPRPEPQPRPAVPGGRREPFNSPERQHGKTRLTNQPDKIERAIIAHKFDPIERALLAEERARHSGRADSDHLE